MRAQALDAHAVNVTDARRRWHAQRHMQRANLYAFAAQVGLGHRLSVESHTRAPDRMNAPPAPLIINSSTGRALQSLTTRHSPAPQVKPAAKAGSKITSPACARPERRR